MRSDRYLTQALVVAMGSFGAASQAGTLSETAIYARCFGMLAQRVIPSSDPHLAQIKAGQKSGVQACISLLERAKLQTNGMLPDPNDTIGRAVLNTFYDFHRSWFSNNRIEQAAVLEFHNTSVDVYDFSEGALAITKNLFGAKERYSDILVGTTPPRATRIRDLAAESSAHGYDANRLSQVGFPSRVYLEFPGFPRHEIKFFPPLPVDYLVGNYAPYKPVQIGELVGIQPNVERVLVPNARLNSYVPGDPIYAAQTPGLETGFNLYEGLGGGILGYPSHVILNLGYPMNTRFDGAQKVPRRWSETAIKTFMCRQLPALREQDIVGFFDGQSPVAFRKGTTCLMCHATMDQMAYVARNIITMSSHDSASDSDISVRRIPVVGRWTASQPPAQGWSSGPVPDFHRQEPSGRFMLRSVTGELIDRPVRRIAGVGEAIAQTEDFYRCAVKRYFEFLTGIQVPFYDRTDPRNEELNRSLTKENIADLRFIEKLASELKTTQSLFQMTSRILESEYFKSTNYRPISESRP